jgi:ABC-type nickel/cobalt efflux system permease component RcnA
LVVDAINAAIESALSGLDVVQSNIDLAAPTGILLFGLITGLRHSMEADHVAAVLSIVASDRKGIKRASLLGAAWGIGHTASLFVAGVVVLMLAINIPESVSSKFEFIVSIMLILLAATAFTGFDIGRFFRGLFRRNKHSHVHSHEQLVHSHEHSHEGSHSHSHKSLVVGMVHGMAGSGALMLVVLSTISSVPLGLAYIAIFGAGSIAGMVGTSTLLGIPFSRFKSAKLGLTIRYVAAATTLIIGMSLVYDLVWVEQIFAQ